MVDSRIDSILQRRQNEGRALTDEELAEIIEVMPSHAPLADFYKEGRKVIKKLVKLASEHVHREYALAENHEASVPKTARDMLLAVWYCGDGLILNDKQVPRDDFHYWMRTMMQAFEFPQRTKRQFNLPNRARQSTPPPQPVPQQQKRGLFGFGRSEQPQPQQQPAASPAPAREDPSDRLGQYVLSRRVEANTEVLFEAYTHILWTLKAAVSDDAYKAWEPYIVDVRDILCQPAAPAYSAEGVA